MNAYSLQKTNQFKALIYKWLFIWFSFFSTNCSQSV